MPQMLSHALVERQEVTYGQRRGIRHNRARVESSQVLRAGSETRDVAGKSCVPDLHGPPEGTDASRATLVIPAASSKLECFVTGEAGERVPVVPIGDHVAAQNNASGCKHDGR